MKRLFALITIIALMLSMFTITTPAKGTPYEYFKSQLSADEQKIYGTFLEATVSSTGQATIPQLSTVQYQFTSDTVISSNADLNYFVANNTSCKNALTKLNNYFKNAIAAATADHPEYYWLKSSLLANLNYGYDAQGKTVKIVNVSVSLPDDAKVSNATQLLNNVNARIQSIGATGTDLQKVKTIHNWLCNNVSYIDAANSHNLYGALFEGKAVCQGYAEAFKAACDYYGVKCVCVEGNAINSSNVPESHMWNYVLINNTWYAVDVTWDDQASAIYEDYFLSGTDTVATHFGNSLFKDTHFPDGVIGGTAAKTFSYPALSQKAYSTSNPTQAPTQAPIQAPTQAPTQATNKAADKTTANPSSQTAPANTTGTNATQAPGDDTVIPTATQQTDGINPTVTPEAIVSTETDSPAPGSNEDNEGTSGSKTTLIIVAASGIGAIVVAAVVVFIIRKRRQKKHGI